MMKFNFLEDAFVAHEIEIEPGITIKVMSGHIDRHRGPLFEFVIEKQGKITNHSDDGYFNPGIALRDALAVQYGIPNREELQRHFEKKRKTAV